MLPRTNISLLIVTLAGVLTVPMLAQDAPPNPRVVVETSEGNFEMELFRDRVPATVVNFLIYVRDGYYNGTVFHRVIRDLIVQGGGMVLEDDNELIRKQDGLRGPIVNQASANLRNRMGTVAMARTAAPDSATSQFFINLQHNTNFDYKNGTADGIGYAVFGQVTDGMDVIRDIGRTRTSTQSGRENVPRDPIIIHSITRVEPNQ